MLIVHRTIFMGGFMARKYAQLSGDLLSIKNMMQATDKVDEFRRFQAVYLRLSQNLSVGEIAKITFLSESWIHQLHGAYKKFGIDGLKSKEKGGRNNELLSEKQEVEVLNAIESEAKKGGVLEVSKVHNALQEKAGKTISKQTAYNILHRHGWRKISPRPKHPKSDKKEQEAFKKTGENFLKKQKKMPAS